MHRGDIMQKRIALLYGGEKSEHNVSVKGYEYLYRLINDGTYEIMPVYVDESGEWHLTIRGKDTVTYPTKRLGGSLYTVYGFIKIDAAIPLLHGSGGEDGKVQGALEYCGIPYVGSEVSASAVCIDKVYTKILADSLGIPTLKHIAFKRNESISETFARCISEIGLPLFIKPRRLGSSVGAYPVTSEEQFYKCYQSAMQLGSGLVMAEKMLKNKRELECALCDVDGKRIITPPGEVLIDGFYGYNEKYGGAIKTVASAELESEQKVRIQEYASMLTEALGLRHLARIDFFLADNKIYFNEINTFPGFTSESLYPKLLIENGIDPAYAIRSFIEDAINGRTF